MKYKVYPKGYDPLVATGLPTDFYLKMGISWTEEDVNKCRELEQQYSISDTKPIGLWCEEIDDS